MRYLNKQNRALLSELVRTDFKLRYQGSVLGYAWSLLRPLLIFVILYAVFVKGLKFGAGFEHFAIYLLFGIVLWQFFSDMTTQSLGSIVGRGDLIRKIRIPRWIIVVSSSVLAFINLLLNLVVVGIFLIFDKVELTYMVFWLPLIILEIYIFALGCSLFLSAAFVKFRDVSYVWEVLMQAAFYATPIIYLMTMVTNETVQKMMLLNPMAQAMQDARYTVVSQDPQVITISRVFDGGWYMLLPFAIVLSALVVGVLYFKKESRYFAENI